ncbi:hypothetical protein KSD_73530 [Ktedonobacter sp. SOSP1-85]|nr:hypothetical protein KSD_73530 [Ktedonobacter sp. SOSP1-85]
MPKPDECLFDFMMNGCSVRRSFWVKRCGDKEKRKDIDAIGKRINKESQSASCCLI